jgi:hypothetical protein
MIFVDTLVVLYFSYVSDCLTAKSVLITFDDVTNGAQALISSPYVTLTWSNLYVIEATLQSNTSGYQTALRSGQWVAFNKNGTTTSSVSSANASFTVYSFIAASVTSDNNFTLTINGYQSQAIVFSTNITLTTNSASFVQLNWTAVEKITFTSPSNISTFAMDNLKLCLGYPR